MEDGIQGNNHRESRGKILVVDDEGKICQMLAEYFSIKGYHVETARRGNDALTLAQAFQPDIVLLDLLMPGLSGIETLKALKQMAPAPKVLMVSVADHDEVIKGALQMGADAYICKPIKLLDLDLLVNDLCLSGHAQP